MALYWLIQNFSYLRPGFETLEKDLTKIQALENEACRAINYSYKYNPVTEKGILIQQEKEVCIETDQAMRCRTILCLAEKNRLDLNGINFVRVDKNGENSLIKIKAE